MQNTSDLYKELLGGSYTVETRLAIGETGTLITKLGEHITFGGTRILVGSSGAAGGYGEDMLISMGGMFSAIKPLNWNDNWNGGNICLQPQYFYRLFHRVRVP